MILNRSSLFAAALGLPLLIAACGSSSSTTTDSGTAGGTHYGYVVSAVNVPASPSDAVSPNFGLDISGTTTDKPDGTVDNQLGSIFVQLVTLAKFPIQSTFTTAVDEGNILLLADLQTTDFSTAASASFDMKLGDSATIMPAPCTNPADTTTCGQQLKGTGSFTVATGSPTNTPLTGPIAGGVLDAGPGNLALQIAIGSTTPIPLNLAIAHVHATQISATGMTAVIGGAITNTDLQGQVLPGVFAQIDALFTRDCGPAAQRTGASCSCTANSTGAQIMGFLGFTGATPHCVVSESDFANNNIVKALVQPDICSQATCTAPDSLSFGAQFKLVKASFPL